MAAITAKINSSFRGESLSMGFSRDDPSSFGR